MNPRPPRPTPGLAFLSTLAVLVAACGGDGPPDAAADGAPGPDAASAARTGSGHRPLVTLLSEGQAIFGVFSGEQTPVQGAAIVEARAADFVLYSLEREPFDLPTMEAYVAAMAEAARSLGVEPQPVLLRVPPVRDGRPEALERTRAAVAVGVSGIVYPHVESADEAAFTVDALGAPWPADPDGTLLDVLIIEDRAGVENARAIAVTPGLGVVFAGPGDLRRTYEGDMEAVEAAIQTVLSACLEADVACGVTAGAHDVELRLEQGFRVIIVTEAEALEVGRAAAGRPPGHS